MRNRFSTVFGLYESIQPRVERSLCNSQAASPPSLSLLLRLNRMSDFERWESTSFSFFEGRSAFMRSDSIGWISRWIYLLLWQIAKVLILLQINSGRFRKGPFWKGTRSLALTAFRIVSFAGKGHGFRCANGREKLFFPNNGGGMVLGALPQILTAGGRSNVKESY